MKFNSFFKYLLIIAFISFVSCNKNSIDEVWEEIEITGYNDTDFKLAKIIFTDQNNGWTVGENNNKIVILKTTDGGITWIEKYVANFTYSEEVNIDVFDNTIVVKTDGDGLFSLDGGETWILPETLLPGDSFYTKSSVTHNSAGEFLFIDYLQPEVKIINLPDVINTQVINIEEQADIRIFTLTGTGDVKIQMEGNLGFIGGIVDSPEKPYYIPKTTDGGKTWENSELPDNVTPYWINDFCFIDNEIIFAIGTQNYNEGAFILYSNNQGKSWEWISPTNIAGLFSISMADKDYGYLIGSKQGVLGKVFVGKTEDSGNTLKKVEFFDDKKDMLDVFVLDKNHAWIVGKGNKIYRLYN